MPKLYTKTGDKGQTSLYDGNRIPKSSIFFKVLGDLDELSSHIGMLTAMIQKELGSVRVIGVLREIQVKLLNIGSNIATVSHKKVPKILKKDVEKLEVIIDECEQTNDKLQEFLLPGIYITDSQCHICRSITRRTERSLWELHHSNEILEGKKNNIDLSLVTVDENILHYVNRLSDFFFAYSRNLSNGAEIKVSVIKKNDTQYK